MDEEQKLQQELADAEKAKADKGKEGGEDDGEGNFDPFATLREKEEGKDKEKKEEKKDDKGDEEEDKGKKKEEEPKNEDLDDEPQDQQPQGDPEYRADKQASKGVREFLAKNPEFGEYEEDLKDLASKAIQRGYKNPVEFAFRNLKSPKEWMDIARQQTQASVGKVLRTRINGTNNRGGGVPDYKAMSDEDFNKELNDVLRG